MARPPFPGSSVAYPLAASGGRAAWHLAVPALASAAAGLWLAWHHPLSPAGAVALFVSACALFSASPMAWLWCLPALLPVIDLAPWTGWISFEEVDLLVLAVAAGGYARLVAGTPPPPAGGRAGGGAFARVGLGLFAASAIWAMARGFEDAGGFSFGWFQGYREPMNSLRLVKGFFEAMLLAPLWAAQRRQAPEVAGSRLMAGMTIGLLAASLAALWERLAYTGLLNFSTDYRTTALFWEMHVGGAAFDGFLALTLPFALGELMLARSGRRWLMAAAVTLLALYACLTTFSRGVYLAAPIGAALTYALHFAQQARREAGSSGQRLFDLWRCLLLAAAYATAAAWMFPSSGYRGILALLGAAALLLPLANALRGASLADWALGLSLGAALALAAVAGAWLLPKGPYAVYAGAAVFTLVMVIRDGRSGHRGALAGYVAVLMSIGLVARHWGGEPALWRALPVIGLSGLAVVLASARAAPPWPSAWRWQITTACAMGVAGSVVAAFVGGAYMTGRFSTSSDDFADRRAHWEQGISMLETTDQRLLGKGLGRYFDNYWLEVPGNQRPGDYRVRAETGGNVLALVAGRHVMGWGELLRVSQRVEPPQGPATVSFDVRLTQPAILHVDVCMKHLLYDFGCLVKQFKLEPGDGGWQSIRATLDGEQLTRGAWYAPKLAAFSISTETADVRVEVGKLVLAGSDGRNLLVNGDFSEGMSRWFFTSDRNHLPWHMKNLLLHVLFEQGGVGLALWCALAVAAFWRVTLGGARGDPLAPAIAGALAGFAVVGLFDSLLDVPRLGLLFYLLVAIALGRRPVVQAGTRHRSP